MPEKIEQPAAKNETISTDLAKYLEFMDATKISDKERTELRKNLEQWDQSGDVEKIRTAGQTQDQNRDNYIRRHLLLSSEFLRKSEGETTLKLKIDFKNNNLAEWRVGMADMMPPNVKKVRLTRADGSTAIGIRAMNPATKRIGYYEENAFNENPKRYEYLACHTGDTCEPLETYQIKDDYLGDHTTYLEHMAIYADGAAKEESSDPSEKQSYDPAKREVQTPAKIKEKKTDVVTNKAKEERERIRREIQNPPTPESRETTRKIDKDFFAREFSGYSHEQIISDPQIYEQARQNAKKWIIDKDPVKPGSNPDRPARITFLGCPMPTGINMAILPYLKQAEADILAAGISYKVKSISSFSWRRTSVGDGTKKNTMSYHAWAAFDINPATNPDQRQQSGPVKTDLPPAMIEILKKYGFVWGNSFRDPMHFDFRDIDPFRSTNLITDPDAIKYLEFAKKAHPEKYTDRKKIEKPQPVKPEVTSEGSDTTRGLKGKDLIQNQQFRNRLKQVAANIGCMPEDLIAIFDFESAGINPQEQNKHGATGLIQWMPSTAKSMYKLNVNQIRAMSGLQQLDLVEIYFKRNGRNNNIDDLYLSVLYPYAKNKPDDFILGSQGGMEQAQRFATNNPFAGKDKQTGKANLVRKADVLRKIRKKRATSKFITLYQQFEQSSS